MPVSGWDVRWFLWVNDTGRNLVLDWVFPPIAESGYLGWLVLLLLIPLLDRKQGKLTRRMGGMILGPLIGFGGTALMGRFWRRSDAASS